MTLINIEYGSLASSEVLNNNFAYLNNSLTSLSSSTENSLSDVNSAIETINTTLTNTATSLNSKIDVDLSNMNASATAKNTIIGWGMPDYSAGITKTDNTVYTADYDCVASIVVGGDATTTAQRASVLILDNSENIIYAFQNSAIGTSSVNVNAYSSAFIPKGTKYKFYAEGGNGVKNIYIFPLKGAS